MVEIPCSKLFSSCSSCPQLLSSSPKAPTMNYGLVGTKWGVSKPTALAAATQPRERTKESAKRKESQNQGGPFFLPWYAAAAPSWHSSEETYPKEIIPASLGVGLPIALLVDGVNRNIFPRLLPHNTCSTQCPVVNE
ncbi:hypothetical protein Taro_032632 [Colocasia esculenta]|uniref:Uncharacterized protein n=1 Tax=Colocasia esculenta TaxID=4460 RepID=A0A843W2F8_COLES|nr:hypothetical protein [Colocasia esculenta]